MGTPLYNTDVIPLTSRPTLTVMDDGDYFTILDTSTGKISKILKTNLVLPASQVGYDNATSGLTATQVQAALDELVVNLGSSDSAISALSGRLDILEADESTEGSVAYDIKQSSDALKGVGYTDGTLKTHEDRLDTLEADDTTEGSVAKTVKDAVEPIEARIDTTELTLARQGQDLASVKQTLQQGNGATLDFTGIGSVALDARATGRANPTIEGLTATNIVDGADIANLGTVTFASVLNHKYFDVIHGTILTGTGSDITVTNDTGATADIAVINLTQTYGAGKEPDLETCKKLFSNYFDGTKSIQLLARVRSVGKNLFDKRNPSHILEGLYIDFSSKIIPNVDMTSVVVECLPSTTYTVSKTAGVFFRLGWTSEYPYHFLPIPSGTYIASDNATSLTITTGANAKYLVASVYRITDTISKTDMLASVQIELGSTATPYEPYTDSTLYIADNEELRSIQDVQDTLTMVNGEYIYTKKVSTPASVASGVAVNVTNYPTAKTGGKFAVELTAGGTQIGVIGTDSTSGAGTLRFEFATPLTINLTTSGILQAKPKGTVYFEPYYEGSHQTNASSQITLPYEGTIDKLTVYDENLEPYEVPSTGYTLVGTTLTITGAEENEVFYVEMSRSEPLAPEMEVNVINNEQVIADTSNGKFYKLVPTITDGVLVSQTPVEVV
jgi:hypothetical protein